MFKAPTVSHRVVVSQIRLSLILSKRGHDRSTVTVERGVSMPKSAAYPEGIDWYPAATFRIEELAMLQEAVRLMREYLQDPPRGNGSSNPAAIASAESLKAGPAALQRSQPPVSQILAPRINVRGPNLPTHAPAPARRG